MLSDVPQTVYLKDYRPPQFLVEQVDLDFDLGEEVTRVVARLLVRRNPDRRGGDGVLELFGERLELAGPAPGRPGTGAAGL